MGLSTGPTDDDAAAPRLTVDVLYDGDQLLALASPHLDTRNTHGTGCSYSSGIAAGLAQDMELGDAVSRAHTWLHNAILHADELHVGRGHGPVHHFHALWT